jgi:hypothetical protein
MAEHETMTLVLGAETDAKLRQAVLWALSKLGAVRDGDWQALAGSQDIDHAEFRIGGERVVLESETYVGLSLSGPAMLVEHLARLTDERLGN